MAAAAPHDPTSLCPPGLLLAALGVVGCSGNHDLLAQRNVDAGVTFDATAADIRGDEGRVVPPQGDVLEASLDDRGDVIDEALPPEPPGRWTLTWLNGLVDAETARFCFVPVVGAEEKRAGVVPQPAGGLRFGESLVLGELPDIDLATMGVHPYAVAGAGGSDGGAGCAAILDAQDGAVSNDGAVSGPVAVALPLIPPGTLVEGRSYLGVATGCARRWPYADAEAGADAAGGDRDGGTDAEAGPGDVATMDVFQPPDRASICGASTGAANAGLVLVRLSRRDVGARFGFQAVHASTAVAGARIALERAGGSAPVFSADLGPFQIVPRDDLITVARSDFGASIGAANLRIASTAFAFPNLTFSFASALAASGIDEAGLTEGDRLSLVLIGALPGQNPGPPWNGAQLVVVRNAPLGGGD